MIGRSAAPKVAARPIAAKSRRGRRPGRHFGTRKGRLGFALVVATILQAALIGPAVRVTAATSRHPTGTAPGPAPSQPGRSAATANSDRPASTPAAPGIVIAAAKFDLPDPYLLTVGGTSYLYVSTAWADPVQNLPVFEGRPGSWGPARDALPALPPWAVPVSQGGLTWAPEVQGFGGSYVLYFSSALQSNPKQHCIGAATSGSPAGPFTALPQPFICDTSQGGDIDAQVFIDRSGSSDPNDPYYLIWKSDNNSTRGDGVTAIWSQPLSPDGLNLLGQPSRIFGPERLSYQARLVEAPQMITSPDGRVWLFYSAGEGFDHADYGIGVASCAGPLGPCTEVPGGTLVRSNLQGAGPGEETVYQAEDGSTWVLYNPWSTAVKYRWVRPAEAVRIGWGATGPYVAEAGQFPH